MFFSPPVHCTSLCSSKNSLSSTRFVFSTLLEVNMAASDVWTCCQCKAANLDANADVKCPIFSHKKCSECPRERRTGISAALGMLGTPSVPNTALSYGPPASIARSAFSGISEDDSHAHIETPVPGLEHRSIFNDACQPDALPASLFTASGSARGPNVGPPRPSTVGWWVCSNCHNPNNPALAPEKCSVCAHTKCPHCIQY